MTGASPGTLRNVQLSFSERPGSGAAVLAPAAADNGDPINAGEDTTSTANTSLTTDIPAGPGIAGLKVVDRSLASLPGTAAIAAHSNGRFGNGHRSWSRRAHHADRTDEDALSRT